MNQRQIYFYDQNKKTYYVSEVFTVSKAMWDVIMEELNIVMNWNLLTFLSMITKISNRCPDDTGYSRVGTRIYTYHSENQIEIRDETYVVYSDRPGVLLDIEHSKIVKKGDVFPNEI